MALGSSPRQHWPGSSAFRSSTHSLLPSRPCIPECDAGGRRSSAARLGSGSGSRSDDARRSVPPGAARSVCARGDYWPGILGGRIRNWGSEPQAAAVLPAGDTSTLACASTPWPAWGRNDGCGPGEEEEEGSARQAGLLGVDAEAEAATHFAARRAQGDAALPRRAGWPTERRRQASKQACILKHIHTHAYTDSGARVYA